MVDVQDPWRHTSLEEALAAPEPMSLDEMRAAGVQLSEDELHAYLMGRYHTRVMVHGAECRDCGERLDLMSARGPLPGADGRPVAREQGFPFRSTLKVVRRGAAHEACGGRLDFDISLLYMDQEGGPIVRFVPDREGEAT